MTNLLTISDVSKKLNVSTRTIKRYLENGKIVGIKLPGGEWRFKEEWVENWVEKRIVKVKQRA